MTRCHIYIRAAAVAAGISAVLVLTGAVVAQPEPGPDLPNLTPYQPEGWSDKIVVTTEQGACTDSTCTDSNLLTSADTLYVDWALANMNSVATTQKFATDFYVDGIFDLSLSSDPGLDLENYDDVIDHPLGPLSVGTHTLTIKVDSAGVIAESNEQDNEYTKTITVVGPAGRCAGDCNGDGHVTVDEIITMANIALGKPVAGGCTAGDPNGDRKCTIDEIVAAVNNALSSCGATSPTPTRTPTATWVSPPTIRPTRTPTVTPTKTPHIIFSSAVTGLWEWQGNVEIQSSAAAPATQSVHLVAVLDKPETSRDIFVLSYTTDGLIAALQPGGSPYNVLFAVRCTATPQTNACESPERSLAATAGLTHTQLAATFTLEPDGTIQGTYAEVFAGPSGRVTISLPLVLHQISQEIPQPIADAIASLRSGKLPPSPTPDWNPGPSGICISRIGGGQGSCCPGSTASGCESLSRDVWGQVWPHLFVPNGTMTECKSRGFTKLCGACCYE